MGKSAFENWLKGSLIALSDSFYLQRQLGLHASMGQYKKLYRAGEYEGVEDSVLSDPFEGHTFVDTVQEVCILLHSVINKV